VEARRVGEDVDCHDLALRDLEGEHCREVAVRSHDESGGSVDERWSCDLGGAAREDERLLGHVRCPTDDDITRSCDGIWKLAAAGSLLVPRLPRLKEWTYAGILFSITGAIASHLAVGDVGVEVPYLTFLTALTFASWALRPPVRKHLAWPSAPSSS